MTRRDRFTKGALFFSILIYYIGGYFLIGRLVSSRDDIHQLALPFEEKIPFVPGMIFAYILVFAFTASSYVAVDNLPFFKKIVKSFFLCVTIHFVFFLLFPVEYVLRPTLPYEGWLNKFIVYYYWVDPVYNCFPSLHVSNVFLVTFLFERYRRGSRKFLLPWAILVAVSVVLVKQHYILDVISGIFVAWVGYRVVFGTSGSLTKGSFQGC
ncbi:MAG: phosphatase PAP2 family protein [Deltaproteobacteria bacterium]|nr:phosphatase PAP2 family protein [Deltaproteobacteria bacterium]